MPLVLTIAFRNLVQDRLRLIATVVGIVFSVVLVTVQMGLFLSFGRMVTAMIEHAFRTGRHDSCWRGGDTNSATRLGRPAS